MLERELVKKCKKKLLTKRQELIENLISLKMDFVEQEKGGDEGDQSTAISAENRLFSMQNKYRNTLLEVDAALARIEKGTFGICDETCEPIEEKRLMALPWTRLSIEGAEMREAFQRKYRAI